MNWAFAAGTGFSAGLLYFGGLWASIRQVKQHPNPIGAFLLTRAARLLLLGLILYGLVVTSGRDALIAGLAGVLAARMCMIQVVGRSR